MPFIEPKILETELGPMISHSRTSVYDVMETLDSGEDYFAICVIHNLKPIQVTVALEYIAKHRDRLEPELKVLLEKKAERERYYRALAAERRKRPVEMTPLREAFYALREKNRRERGFPIDAPDYLE